MYGYVYIIVAFVTFLNEPPEIICLRYHPGASCAPQLIPPLEYPAWKDCLNDFLSIRNLGTFNVPFEDFFDALSSINEGL